MTRLRAWIRSFFGFSRAETNAFVILLPLMAALIFSEPIYRYWFVHQPQDFAKEKNELDSLIKTWKWEEPDRTSTKTFSTRLSSFDPNKATRDELIELGLDNSLANRILNYRLKGGKFALKKDLLKIYGMDSVVYKNISPYINLPDRKQNLEKRSAVKEKPIIIRFDLNLADTSQLIKIYGIGPKLSKRIVTYRDKLGGFISLDQLGEVYGLDSILIRELHKKTFITENFIPRLVDINKASEKELGDHPYIKYKLAKAISAYRFQHGVYRTVDEVKRISILDDVKFQKIKPYLSANP